MSSNDITYSCPEWSRWSVLIKGAYDLNLHLNYVFPVIIVIGVK